MDRNDLQPAPVANPNPADSGEDVRRLAAFSDAVFAIAMTLLVLEIDRPDPDVIRTGAELRHALAQWQMYGAFALSFGVIALYWRAHFRTFARLRRVDDAIVWLNILLLLGITFLPFPTSVLEGFSDQRLAVMLYAGTLAAIGFVWAALWEHALRHGLLETMPGAQGPPTTRRQLFLTPLIFLLSIGVAMIDVDWAMYSWLLVILADAPVRRRHRSPSS